MPVQLIEPARVECRHALHSFQSRARSAEGLLTPLTAGSTSAGPGTCQGPAAGTGGFPAGLGCLAQPACSCASWRAKTWRACSGRACWAGSDAGRGGSAGRRLGRAADVGRPWRLPDLGRLRRQRSGRESGLQESRLTADPLANLI